VRDLEKENQELKAFIEDKLTRESRISTASQQVMGTTFDNHLHAI